MATEPGPRCKVSMAARRADVLSLAASLPSDPASASLMHMIVDHGHWHAPRRCIARHVQRGPEPFLAWTLFSACTLLLPSVEALWCRLDAPSRYPRKGAPIALWQLTHGTAPPPAGAAPAAAAVAASTHKPCPLTGAAASVDELFSSHLALDLDEDCLKLLLLGEEAAESRPCTSGSGGSSGPAAAAGSGTSQKSSATGERLLLLPGQQQQPRCPRSCCQAACLP